MPLSEHEQRQLEQIEQSLYADYPRFAHAVRASDPRVHYKRRVVEAAFGFLLGIGMLLGGVVAKYIWIGVAGFVVMLACAMWALSSWRHMTGTPPPCCRRAAPTPAPHAAGLQAAAGRDRRRGGRPAARIAAAAARTSRVDGTAGGAVAPAPGARPLAVSPPGHSGSARSASPARACLAARLSWPATGPPRSVGIRRRCRPAPAA